MKSKHSKDKKRNIIIIIFRIISILVIIYCLIYIFNWYMENKKSADMLSNVTNSSILDTIEIEIPNNENSESTEDDSKKIIAYELDFDNLSSINSSTVGWITVFGTSINYPVVKGSDNSFYLSHSFTEYVGTSPINYLMETRLAASKELLLSSSRSIAEVASSTGFSSQSYFSQIFRKNTGMSPLQYRKLKQTDSKTMQDDSYYI